MRLSTRLTTAVAALALAAAPAVAYAHGGHHHGHHKVHGRDHRDAGPIGKVASFTNDTLSVTLGDGSPIAGKVTRRTVIKCDTAAPQSTTTPATAPTTATPRLVRSDHGNGGDGNDNGRDANHGNDHQPPSSTVPGDNHGRGDEVGNGRCDPTALTTDTVVENAQISLTSQGAIWKKVVLLK